MRNDNPAFYRLFESLPVSSQVEILRDTARFYREERNDDQRAKQLEEEAFCIENWSAITRGAL